MSAQLVVTPRGLRIVHADLLSVDHKVRALMAFAGHVWIV
jgi:hypothetical protein